MRTFGTELRSTLAILFAGALGLLQLGCQSIDIASDWDPEVDFSTLSTYDWMPEPAPTGPGPGANDSLRTDRVHSAVDRILAERGYVKTPTGTPDFLVGYYAAVESKLDVTTLNDYYGYRPGWGYGGYGGSSRTYVREYEQGTLILDVSNPLNSKLMWRGSARAEVGESETPQEREAVINEAVGLILDRFPPRASQ